MKKLENSDFPPSSQTVHFELLTFCFLALISTLSDIFHFLGQCFLMTHFTKLLGTKLSHGGWGWMGGWVQVGWWGSSGNKSNSSFNRKLRLSLATWLLHGIKSRRINIESKSANTANLIYSHTYLRHHDRLAGNDVT